MGCGSSTAMGGGSSMTKDPEDFHLEHLHFKKMKVPEFDEYLCDEIQPTTNKMIDIVNEINSYIDDIKEAAVMVCGGYKLHVEVDGAVDHDKLIVSMTKADGTYPTAEQVAALLADAKVTKADEQVSKARKALHAALEKSNVKLKVDPTGNVASDGAPPPEIDALNKAVAELRTAAGPEYKIVVQHKEAGVGGARCVRAALTKFVLSNPDSDDYQEQPLSILDVLKSKEAKNLVAAELSVADALAGLSKAVKAAEDAGVTVDMTMKKKKLVITMEGGDQEDSTSDRKAAARKALSTANSQLFKLSKAARNANGIINIAKALVAVFEALKKKVMKLANRPSISDILKINPTFKCNMNDGDFDIDFDFGVSLDHPDFKDFTGIDLLMKILPGPAKLVLKAILAVKDKLVELFPEFKPIADEVIEAVKKAEEVFADAGDKVKAAFGDDVDIMKIGKAVAAATGNMKIVTMEPVKVITTMKDTIIRLSDELQASVTEIKALCA